MTHQKDHMTDLHSSAESKPDKMAPGKVDWEKPKKTRKYKMTLIRELTSVNGKLKGNRKKQVTS